MRYLQFIFVLLISISANAQSNYSKLYDIDLNLVKPYIETKKVGDETWIVCLNNDWGTTLTKYDSEGNKTFHKIIDDFVPAFYDMFWVTEDSIFIIGSHNKILKGDKELNSYYVKEYELETDNIYWNEGILHHENNYYTYGQARDPENKSYTNIVKWDSSLTVIEDVWKRSYDGFDNCKDLIFTINGNLAFVNFIGLPGAGHNDNAYILELDIDGAEINRKVFELEEPQNLFISKNGDFVFASEENLIKDQLQGDRGGVVNRMDSELEELKWSVDLPTNVFLNEREYTISDFSEASNGDIVVCGSGLERDGPLGFPLNYEGFLVRISSKGEIVWKRFYRLPNTYKVEEYGDFNPAFLQEVRVDDNGGIVVVGNNYQRYDDDMGNQTARRDIWLLSVDENGFIQGEEQQEIISIDSMVVYNQKPIFDIGTRWTYEYLPKPYNPLIQEHSFIIYEVTDTIQKEGKLAYVIENNRGLPTEYMHQSYQEIYFWDTALEDWQLTYDFDGKFSYDTDWVGYVNEEQGEDVRVNIDTILFAYAMLERGHINEQFVTIDNNGTFEEPLETSVLKWIGQRSGGLRLNLGNALVENDYKIGDIRCFEEGELDWNFGPLWPHIPCDTIYQEQVVIECTEHTMLCPENVWYQNEGGVSEPPYTRKYKVSEEYIEKDNQWYQELLYSKYNDDNNWEGTGVLLREEGSKVWRYDGGNGTLVYDFGMEVGDTILFENQNTGLVVMETDSITLLDNSKRKTLLLNCIHDPDVIWLWIEGIGSNLFTGTPYSCFLDNTSYLRCFFQDGELLYRHENIEGCWLTAVSGFDVDPIKMSPNPVVDYLYLEDIEKVDNYVIYHINGHKVKEGNISNRIDCTMLTQGVYLIKLMNNQGDTMVKKMIKL